jgi:four helix bundle protein
MGTIKRFEELNAWQTGRELSNCIYDLAADDPFATDHGLRDQIRRAAVSVMSNIAEGFSSRTQKLIVDLLGRARGSTAEVQAQLYLARDRDYIGDAQFDEAYGLADRTSRQIHGLIRYLKSQPNASRVQEGEIRYEVDDEHT